MLLDHQDAYGHAMLDHLGGLGGYEIVERDDGLIEPSAGPGVYFSTFDTWPSHLQEAMALARGRVLDIGCGAGRVSLYLQEQGCDVTGIDLSPLAAEVCRRRGLSDVRVMSITEIGPGLGTYDTMVMMGNNLGLLGGFRRARWLLRRMKAITTPSARILASTTDPYATDDPDHLAYHELNRRRGRMGGQLRLRVRYKRYRTPWLDYLLVNKQELDDIVDGTGWRVEGHIDAEERPSYIAILGRT